MNDHGKWKYNGVRVVHGHELDINTPQTPGMNRAAAITNARTGAKKLWAGTVVIHPKAKTGAHHHGPVESVIYVVRGRARMRWGEHLQFMAEAGPGDFIYVPPYVPHQEINANDDEELACVLVRSGQDPVVVNLDIPVVEPPEGRRCAAPSGRGRAARPCVRRRSRRSRHPPRSRPIGNRAGSGGRTRHVSGAAPCRERRDARRRP
jgi:uncharacterized RmlC-like cupin family protein